MFHFAEMIKIDLTAFIKSIICSVKNYMIAATAVLAGSEHFWTKNNITQNRKRFITQPKYMICFSYWMWLILITPFPHKFGPKIATFRGFHKFSLKILDCNTIVISFNWTSCSNIFHWKSTKKTRRNWDYHRHLSEHFYLRPFLNKDWVLECCDMKSKWGSGGAGGLSFHILHTSKSKNWWLEILEWKFQANMYIASHY